MTNSLYRKLLEVTEFLGKPRLVRIWNYIPFINDGDADNECYRQFCWGRADALAGTVLPAATGIGSQDDVLRISALCTPGQTQADSLVVEHLENPRQISAYDYPRRYGPKSPSFARATLVTSRTASRSITTSPSSSSGLLLLSGTASIVDHETRHPYDLQKQSEETARNIQALLATLEQPAAPLALRYYLRNPDRLQEAVAAWREHFADWPLPAFYRGDICRAELELEVEGVFRV